MIKKIMQAGQITLLTAVIGAGGMVLASALTSWATTYNKVQKVQQEVSVIAERENNRYSELKDSVNRIEHKLDKLIESQIKR